MSDYIEHINDLINANPCGDTIAHVLDDMRLALDNNMKQALYKACIAIDVDPEVVEKQANLIMRLQKELEFMSSTAFGADPREIVRLRRENEEMREKLEKLRDMVEDI